VEKEHSCEKIVQNTFSLIRIGEVEEKIITKVFDFFEHENWHSALIASVPELLAFYFDDPASCQHFEKFRELIDFYKLEVFLVLKRLNKKSCDSHFLQEFEDSKIVFKEESLECFNFELKNEGIQVITSNCVPLTLKLIHQKFRDIEGSTKLIFVSLDLLNTKNLKVAKKQFNLNLNSKLVVDCSNESVTNIQNVLNRPEAKEVMNHLLLVLDKNSNFERFWESSSPESVKQTIAEHSWSQLTEESQETLKKYVSVNFQGESIKLNKILCISSKFIYIIPDRNSVV
jgi:hypothetical protein